MNTHLSHDTCAYKQALQQSTRPMDYMLYPGKHYNCHQCRIERGIIGGNNVSISTGNLVDLESDLRGQTRMATDCSAMKFLPGQPGPNLQNLPGCQLVNYRRIPPAPSTSVPTCPNFR